MNVPILSDIFEEWLSLRNNDPRNFRLPFGRRAVHCVQLKLWSANRCLYLFTSSNFLQNS